MNSYLTQYYYLSATLAKLWNDHIESNRSSFFDPDAILVDFLLSIEAKWGNCLWIWLKSNTYFCKCWLNNLDNWSFRLIFSPKCIKLEKNIAWYSMLYLSLSSLTNFQLVNSLVNNFVKIITYNISTDKKKYVTSILDRILRATVFPTESGVINHNY